MANQKPQWVAQNPPAYLYRYIPLRGQEDCTRAEALVTKGLLGLSSPERFNDPFDCLPIAAVPKTRIGRERLLRGAMRRVSGKGPNDVAEARIQSFINSPEIMKDEMEAAFRSTVTKAGVACFSEQADTVLMWSHYADNHRGAVIRFRMNEWPIAELPLILKVDYSPERPVIRLRHEIGDNEDLILGLTRKADFWGYENEWRLVVKGGAGSTVHIPSTCLDGVILGAAMPSEQRALVKSWVAKRGAAFEVLRADICRREFRLSVTGS